MPAPCRARGGLELFLLCAVLDSACSHFLVAGLLWCWLRFTGGCSARCTRTHRRTRSPTLWGGALAFAQRLPWWCEGMGCVCVCVYASGGACAWAGADADVWRGVRGIAVRVAVCTCWCVRGGTQGGTRKPGKAWRRIVGLCSRAPCAYPLTPSVPLRPSAGDALRFLCRGALSRCKAATDAFLCSVLARRAYAPTMPLGRLGLRCRSLLTWIAVASARGCASPCAARVALSHVSRSAPTCGLCCAAGGGGVHFCAGVRRARREWWRGDARGRGGGCGRRCEVEYFRARDGPEREGRAKGNGRVQYPDGAPPRLRPAVSCVVCVLCLSLFTLSASRAGAGARALIAPLLAMLSVRWSRSRPPLTGGAACFASPFHYSCFLCTSAVVPGRGLCGPLYAQHGAPTVRAWPSLHFRCIPLSIFSHDFCYLAWLTPPIFLLSHSLSVPPSITGALIVLCILDCVPSADPMPLSLSAPGSLSATWGRVWSALAVTARQ